MKPDFNWQLGVDAPRDGTLFLALNSKGMEVINWPPDKRPGVWRYSYFFSLWLGYARPDFEDFDFWLPLPPPPVDYDYHEPQVRRAV